MRLALARIPQFREGLTDRQAADAVKTKIAWKYLLCLELQDQGFHHTVLSEFRSIGFPYNTEARYHLKRTTGWSGYKILLTESYDDETPNIITNVATSHAAVSDDAVTAKIHAALAQRDLLPEQHLADTGFVNSELIVLSQQDYATNLMVPSRADNSWQGNEGKGFSAQDFRIIWNKKHAVCPEGKASIR